VKLQSFCERAFVCAVLILAKPFCCAHALPSLATLERFDQQHFAKTKMGYISLPSVLNAIIGIVSYFCVTLKMVILHDAMKTIQNIFLKNKNLFLF